MDRRELLKGGTAASLVGSLFGPEALASSELPLEERLVQLEEHTELLGSRPPAPLLVRGLRAAGLSERTFSNILSGLLFARVFKDCSELEQKDARWLSIIERIVPRFTESLAGLMQLTEGREDTRAVRRMLRRPNKLTRIVNHGLLGKTSGRDRELRQAMAGLTSEPNPLADLSVGMDTAAQELGTTRQALAQPHSADEDAASEGQDGSSVSEDSGERDKVAVGLRLLGVAAICAAVGLLPLVLTFTVASSLWGLSILGIPLCIAAFVLLIKGIVFIIQGRNEERRTSEELEQEMSDLDLLLLGDVEDLLAA
jgi:hypothetical protein